MAKGDPPEQRVLSPSDDKSGQAKQVIVQVKSDYVGSVHVRELTTKPLRLSS